MNKLIKEIKANYNTIMNPKDKKSLHNARYKLFEMAETKLEKDVFERCLQNFELQSIAEKIKKKCFKVGIAEEVDIATKLLSKDKLTFSQIYDSYYGNIYEEILKKEEDYLDFHKYCDFCYIGGGALPVPAMILANKYPMMNIDIVDSCEKSVDLSKKLIKKIGIKNINVIHDKAENCCYDKYCSICLANWLFNKEKILKKVSEKENNKCKRIIIRNAIPNSLSFIIQSYLSNEQIEKNNMKILSSTKTNTSLNSVIAELSSINNIICNKI